MEKGKITQVIGPVIDVVFSSGKLPMIRDALTVEIDGKKRYMEVAQHMGNRTVRYQRGAEQKYGSYGYGKLHKGPRR